MTDALMPTPTTEQGLLRAILDQPADDNVRLVYADWLQENGQGERAELIRVQIEIARSSGQLPHRHSRSCKWYGLYRTKGSYSPSAECAKCRPSWLQDRQAKLWRGRAYGAPPVWFIAAVSADYFGRLDSHRIAVYRRGFVESVTCSADAWLEHGAAIMAAHPVSEIRLPLFRVEIAPPDDGCRKWRCAYYDADNHWLSTGLRHTRGQMVSRIMHDVRRLEAELTENRL